MWRVLAAWLLPCLALAGEANLSWVNPTTRTDGTPYTNPAGIRIYERCGTDSLSPIAETGPAQTSYQRSGLPAGTTCFWSLTAFDLDGLESARTNEASKTFPPAGEPLPEAPSNLVITWAGSSEMATITHVQSATQNSGASPRAATFGSTPVEGNLLIVVAGNRSGTSAASAAISGSGWTQFISQDVELGNSSFRRSTSAWWKVAGASEPTEITVTWTGTISVNAREYAADAAVTWELEATDTNDNGQTNNAASLSLGTTASVGANNNLVFGSLTARANDTAFTVDSFTTLNLANLVSNKDASQVSDVVVATANLQSDASGTKTSTANVSNQNTGLSGFIAVFSATEGGAPAASLPPQTPHSRYAALLHH